MHRLGPALATLLLLLGAPGRAEPAGGAKSVYGRYHGRVLRIRILEKSSRTQSAVGSGFAAGSDGLVVTNYHVIQQLVWKADDYTAVAELDDGQTRVVSLLDIDVVHDLALVRLEGAALTPVPLAAAVPSKGQRLYAMGDPLDLGMTIVEGSYSGLLSEALVPRVHFTGSLNPGMSGGPVLDAAGAAVGVSDATSGNQVSFLVPIRFVKELLSRSRTGEAGRFKERITAQLLAHQDETIAALTAKPLPTQSLGAFKAPGQPSSAFRCWANTNEAKEQPYEAVRSSCHAEGQIYVTEWVYTSGVRFVHHGLKTSKLDALQFSALERRYVNEDGEGRTGATYAGYGRDGDGAEVTPYECENSLVTNSGGLVLKGIVCLRAHKELRGLYDLRWIAGTLADAHSGVVTTLDVDGVTRENAARFLKLYIEAFSWKK